MENPILYILCGLPYSGKTTIAKSLAREFGFGYVSIDVIRERLGFTWEENDKVTPNDWGRIFETAYVDMLNKLREGKSVIFDSTNHDFDSREKLRTYAAEAGAKSNVVFIDVPLKTIWERWQSNQSSKARSHIGKELVEWTINHFEAPQDIENIIRYEYPEDIERWIQSEFTHKGSL